MTENDFNQNTTKKRTFCDFIYAMTGYQFFINDKNRAELVGKTNELEDLSQSAGEITETLLLGLQSFGGFMAQAMDNNEYKATQLDLINAGHFVSLIAESANTINEVALQTKAELNRRKLV